MKRRALTVIGAVAVAGGILSGSAAATPPSGDMTRTELAKGETDAPISIVADGPTAFYVQQLLAQPGATTGWHTHPGPELAVIKGGAVQVQRADNCEMVTYVAGQILFVPAGVAHRATSFGPGQAELMVTYTVPADSPVRDEAPESCP